MAKAIEFKLFAPYNKGAALIGSFSKWENIPMEKDDQGYFRTSVNLEDGVYEYKFRVQTKTEYLDPDSWVYAIDPYAKEIDKTGQNAILRIKDGQPIVDTYVWQHDQVPLPSNGELVIYEMLVGNFCGQKEDREQGSFEAAIAKLDYLADLGINAIELMPVMAGDQGWGYLVSHYFAPAPHYGSSFDLKRFIDECHARGIRVILDIVLNHSNDECPLLKIDRDYWYYHHKHYPDDDNNWWGPEFNYDHHDSNLDIRPAWSFTGDVVQYWIQEYHIDGFRYDALSQLANWEYLHWIANLARETAGSKPFYNIGEHIPEKPKYARFEGPMDGCWHESFHYFLVDYICNNDSLDLEQFKEVLDCKTQGYEASTNVINYLSNHDQERILNLLGDRGIFDDHAFRRTKLGAAILMTTVGIPMLWMGQEFGQDSCEHPNQTCELKWYLLDNERNRSLFDYYKGLIALRRQNYAIQSENIEFIHENPEDQVIAYIRWNEEGSRVVVVANFSGNFLGGYTIPDFPDNGKWHEWTRNYDIESHDNQLVLDLGEYEAQVFVWNQ
ncbi:alpha-amylase family glycosyl hydrolase [Laspinema sp. D1]|uniref:Alpha-amylase family glycosyl hydrolase n=1 Tax=Laspinema palackyanum D2a TaxID=2953684 RepID=A0ABT2MTY2_9CYAN|nr:alpha-amylase family glycosyl hydrolase [Laspinema sp. D2a]